MSGRDVIEEPAVAIPGVSRRRFAVGLCTGVVAIAFESIAVATAMPAAARELGGLDYYAWSFSAFVIGMLFATVVAGRLCDRIGPARPLLVGGIVFLAGLLLAGTATTMAQLVAGRLVQGLGSGAMNTATFVCVARVFPAAQRPRMFTWISAAWVLPSFVGPPVAAWLTERLSWHWVFHAVIPLLLFGAAMLAPSLRAIGAAPPPLPAAGSLPVRPAPLWAAAVAAAAAAVLQLAGQRQEDAAAPGLDAAAVLLAVAGVAALAVSLPPLMPAGFLRFRRGLSPVIVSRGLLAGAFLGGEAFVPLMLVETRQVPLVWAGAVLTVGSVGWTAGSWLQSRTWLPVRRDRLITLGCASLAVGLVAVAAVAAWPALPYGLVALGWVFAGLGMGFAVSSSGLAVMTLSAAAEQGRNGASLNLFDALGSAVFVGVAGTVFTLLRGTADLPGTFAAVSASMGVVAVLGALASLRIGPVRDEVSA